MRTTYLFLLIALLLAACGPGDTEPAATVPLETQKEAEAVVVATDTALPESPASAAEPEPATAAPTAETAAETVAEPTAEAVADAPEPEPAEAADVNGPYEGTYFRGSADAPVTMIDYSDFL